MASLALSLRPPCLGRGRSAARASRTREVRQRVVCYAVPARRSRDVDEPKRPSKHTGTLDLGQKSGVLCDLDGVLFSGDEIIPGAIETVEWLRAQEVPLVFLTNTTMTSAEGLAKKLNDLGIPAKPENILSPVTATVNWCRKNNIHKIAMFTEPIVQRDVAAAGVEVVSGSQAAEVEVDAVVLGDMGPAWCYETMNEAFRALMANPNAPLISLGMTRFYNAATNGSGEHKLALDVGPFTVALEYAADRKAICLGKPARAFFEEGIAALGIPASDALMVGDDIRSDVGAAQEAGVDGVLVRTGKFSESDLGRGIEPAAIVDSVADLPALVTPASASTDMVPGTGVSANVVARSAADRF